MRRSASTTIYSDSSSRTSRVPGSMRPDLGPAVGVPGAALRQVSLRLGETTLELLEYKSPPSETTRTAQVQQLWSLPCRVSRRRHSRGEGRARGEGHRVLQRRERRRRRGSRRVEVGVLPGSGWLPARARRGCLLQRSGAARWHRDLSRVAVIASAGRGRRPPSPTTRTDKSTAERWNPGTPRMLGSRNSQSSEQCG